MSRHLDPAEVTAYVDGELEAPARLDAVRHLANCAGCQAEVDASTMMRRLLRQRTTSALAASQPLDFTPRRRRLGKPALIRPGIVVGAAAVAVLSLTIVLRPSHVEATGVIGDSACGLNHAAGYTGDQRTCTLNCVRRGAEFVLLVGEQIYPIENQTFGDLARFADAMVTITGTLDDGAITVQRIVRAGGQQAVGGPSSRHPRHAVLVARR